MTLCLVNNIGTENKKNCAAKRIFHYIANVKAVLLVRRGFVASRPEHSEVGAGEGGSDGGHHHVPGLILHLQNDLVDMPRSDHLQSMLQIISASQMLRMK